MTSDSMPPDLLDGAPPPAAVDAPIVRQTLHEAVLGRVRDMVIEGVLAPGTRINEVQLCRGLGVSRTPLREALKTLAGEGLIELVPSRGAMVRKLTPKEVQGELEVLEALEALAGRLACERGGDDAIAAVVATHAAMMRLYEAGDRLNYYKLNQQIHTDIVALADNATLSETQGAIQARLKRIRFIGNHAPEKWQDAVAEHEAMIQALIVRDGAALAEILAHHLRQTWRRVRDVV